MSKWQKTASVVLVIIGAALYLMMGSSQNEVVRRQTFTVYSQTETGLSVFYRFVQRLKGDEHITTLKEPIFYLEDIASYNTLLFLAPRGQVTDRQRQNITDYVESGGELLVSFHDDASRDLVKNIVKGFKIPEAKRDESFENGKTTSAVASKDLGFLRQNETYEFYSALQFSSCKDNEAECYYVQERFGRGKIHILLGVPLMSNFLIGHADNAKFADRLAAKSPILVDEYFHHFNRRTFWDIFELPLVVGPMIGLIILVMCYFLFAHTRFHEQVQTKRLNRANVSVHHITRKHRF